MQAREPGPDGAPPTLLHAAFASTARAWAKAIKCACCGAGASQKRQGIASSSFITESRRRITMHGMSHGMSAPCSARVCGAPSAHAPRRMHACMHTWRCSERICGRGRGRMAWQRGHHLWTMHPKPCDGGYGHGEPRPRPGLQHPHGTKNDVDERGGGGAPCPTALLAVTAGKDAQLGPVAWACRGIRKS